MSKKNRSNKKYSGSSSSADSTPGRNSPATLPTASRYEAYDENKSSDNPAYKNGYDVNDSVGELRPDEYKSHTGSK